jgi:hypothetical protein
LDLANLLLERLEGAEQIHACGDQLSGDDHVSLKSAGYLDITFHETGQTGDTVPINAIPGSTEAGDAAPVPACAPQAIAVRRIAPYSAASVWLHSAAAGGDIIQPAHSMAFVAPSQHAIAAHRVICTQHTRGVLPLEADPKDSRVFHWVQCRSILEGDDAGNAQHPDCGIATPEHACFLLAKTRNANSALARASHTGSALTLAFYSGAALARALHSEIGAGSIALYLRHGYLPSNVLIRHPPDDPLVESDIAPMDGLRQERALAGC